MDGWQIALALVSAAFAGMVAWRARPLVGSRTRRNLPPTLRAARDAIAEAKSPAERAKALCDAGDLQAAHLGGSLVASGHYLRALRTDPASVEVIRRAVATFAMRPKVLESLLLRKLASVPWMDETRPVAIEALTHLVAIYARRRRSVHGRIYEKALEALTAET